MNLWFRMLRVVILSLFRPRLGYFDELLIAFRVWPNDLDVNIHMNNARYLAVMDLGRFDMFLRTGLWRLMIARKWQPLLGAAAVRFRRALRPFERFEVRSRVIGWDERRIYMDHRVEVEGTVACHAIMWAAFRTGGQRLDPAEIADAVGMLRELPPLPEWVQRWRDLDATIDPDKTIATAQAAQ